MRIINFNNFDLSKLNRFILLHGYKLKNGYVFVDKNNKIFGYCVLIPLNNNIKIDWIYAKKGYGTDFIKRIEKTLSKKYDKIILDVSIDPNERKKTVKRRINFYIKNNYRIYDIKFRKKHGPMFKMFKKI